MIGKERVRKRKLYICTATGVYSASNRNEYQELIK
jgi:hypothetical protein